MLFHYFIFLICGELFVLWFDHNQQKDSKFLVFFSQVALMKAITDFQIIAG